MMNKHSLPDTRIVIAFLLAGATLAVYGQVRHFEFVGYDDFLYIPLASKDLSWKSVLWAFTTLDFANWHPLTWLSLILDYNLFGTDASGYHVTNLAFHIANTVLLFYLLHAMTGALYRSALVAALFALHPLHVESVAWVSERKDVLSALFWILALRAYVSYARNGGGLRYAAVLALFAAGLTAKPMLVTLPFVLLLLDYWPLKRIDWGQEAPDRGAYREQPSLRSLILEKVPLLALSLSSSVITFLAQKNYHAVMSFDRAPLPHRIANALNAYAGYLGDTFRFRDLKIFYPYPQGIDFGEAGFSFLLIASITALAVFLFRRAPYVPVGWFWFLGTLVPVIGLVQIGFQARSDRYTYIPLIGIFIILSWGLARISRTVRQGNLLAAFAALAFVSWAAFAAWHQTALWKDNLTLFGHVIRHNPDSHTAHHILGHTLARSGDPERALQYYYRALKIKPDYDPAYIGAGNVLQGLGRLDEAMRCYGRATEINPRSDRAEYNLGVVLLLKGRPEEAIGRFNRALRIRPDNGDAYNNLGIAFMKTGDPRRALAAFRNAVRLDPGNGTYQKNLAVVESAAAGRPPESLK